MEEGKSDELPVANENGENEENDKNDEPLPATDDDADVKRYPTTTDEIDNETANSASPQTNAIASDEIDNNGPSIGIGDVDDETPENANPDQLTDEMKETFLVDAIGDTLYSKRFVLKTLLSLSTLDASLSEDFEKDLCTLWDMTIEEDVVKLMLEHNVLEIFSNIIQTTDDQRLTEILIGIIGNMCALASTRDILCQQADTMVPMIELIECTDSLVLLQLMRVFHSALVFENSGDECIWFEHFRAVEQFVEKFAYILSNSTSSSLLLHAYEALNAICTKLSVIEIQPDAENKSSFRDLFVKPVLIEGVIDAFRQMLPAKQPNVTASPTHAANETNGDDDSILPTKKTKRVVNLFLDISVILSQYEDHSMDSFEPYIDTFYDCLAYCLEPLCNPMHLLPLTVQEQILIENVNEISQALEGHFHARCFEYAIIIWSEVMQMLTDKETNGKANSDNDDNVNDEESEWDRVEANGGAGENDEVSGSDVCITLMEFIQQSSKATTISDVAASIISLDSALIVKLCEALSHGTSEDDIRQCYEKLREAAKLNWEIVIESKAEPERLTDNDDDGERNGLAEI